MQIRHSVNGCPKNIVADKHRAHGCALESAELHRRGEEIVVAGGNLAQVKPLEHADPRAQKRLVRRYLVALYADGEGIRAYELESDVGELVRGATVK